MGRESKNGLKNKRFFLLRAGRRAMLARGLLWRNDPFSAGTLAE
jgi:hypothetical protein